MKGCQSHAIRGKKYPHSMATPGCFSMFVSYGLFLPILYVASLDFGNDNPKFSAPIENVTVPIGREAVIQCGVDNLSTYKQMFQGLLQQENETITSLRNRRRTRDWCIFELETDLCIAWLRVDTQTILTIHSHVITKNHRIGVTHSEHRTWYLHIRDVRETDKGWYMCQINTDPMKSQIGYLDVVVPPDILDYPTSTDMVVREGSNVSLKCAATGSPQPTITWRREGGEIIPLGTGSEVISVEGSLFNISKVNRLHMGPYLCIASNGVPPSVSKRIMLIVHFPPMIWIQNQLVGAYEKQQITLECHSEAYPKSINYWMRDNGTIISQGAKYEPVMVDNAYKVHMKLTIKTVGKGDYGSYKCVSKNSLGDTDGTIKLYHIPTPSTPQRAFTTTIQPPLMRPTAERGVFKQKGRQNQLGVNSQDSLLSAETEKKRDLKLRENPNNPSSQELDNADNLIFSSSIHQTLFCTLLILNLIVTLL